MGSYKKSVTHVTYGQFSAILNSKMAASKKLIFSKNEAYMANMHIKLKLLARGMYISIFWIDLM